MKYRKLNLNLIIGIILTCLVIIPSVSTIFRSYDANAMNGLLINHGPSLQHPFGTDNFGRDIFMRVMEGSFTTFLISLSTVLIGAVIGTLIGAFTGYFGGIVDEVLMRLNDGLASFPSILLALVVVSVLSNGKYNIVIALGLVFIPGFARIMRAEFKAERDKDYVKNAKLMGAGHLRIIFIHILPNTLTILFSASLVGINNAILAEAGLSYLGLGVQPPTPSLGRMLSESQPFIISAPWYVISVSLVMILAILGLTLIGENIGVSGVNLRSVKKQLDRRRREANKLSDEKLAEGDAGKPGDMHEGVPEAVKCVDNDSIIEVEKLSVSFIEEENIETVINNISFSLKSGEVLGVVGESGSGKSLTALSVMGILADKGCITHGRIWYRDEEVNIELTSLDEEEYCKLRGGKMAMIFQEPMTSLNPVLTIGTQIDEVLDIHAQDKTETEHRERVLRALEDTGLDQVDKLYDMYPHQLSGGMRQRVMIAMALIAKARVIIADEPTTALDVATQDIILGLLKRINRKYGTSILLISHDMRVVEGMCDRALIMHKGIIEEVINISENEASEQKTAAKSDNTGNKSFETPKSEYGIRLLNAAYSRKSYVINKKTYDEEPIVAVRGLNVFYTNRTRNIFKSGVRKQVNFNLSFDVFSGETVGIVGSSGCGKSTFVKALAGLQQDVEGEVIINCNRPSMVFQDPYGSLNPVKRVGWLLAEPLRISGELDKAAINRKVDEMLDNIELDGSYKNRRISELSGGERQRVAIALTIMQRQDIILLDEPVSALDVTIQEQILELLMKLKRRYNLAYVFISHDMRLIQRTCNRVYVMEEGRFVSITDTGEEQ